MGFMERIREAALNEQVKKPGAGKTDQILRFNSVIMCIYFLAILVAFLRFDSLFIPACAIPCFAAYILLFYLTYLDKTKAALIFHQAISLIFVVLFVYMYGWWCGVQHFIFAILVMLWVIDEESLRGKLIKSAVLCLFRLALYFYTGYFRPAVEVPEHLGVYFQITNTVAIFASAVSCLYLSMRSSSEMEKTISVYGEKDRLSHEVDLLTGLLNRRCIMEYLETAVHSPKGDGKKVCLAVADVDGFRKINEKYGHACGDVILRQVACQLKNFIDGRGAAGRWGGEEFLIVFDGAEGEDAYYMLTTLQRGIREHSFSYRDENLHLTLTYGLIEYSHEGNVDSNILEAEKKLCLGKQSGRNTIIF